jgi:hypothetical protein
MKPNQAFPTLLLLAGLPAAAIAAEEIVIRAYEVRQLDVNEAALLARQKCLEMGEQECEYRVKGAAFFEFVAAPRVQEMVQTLIAERDVPSPTQVFQVTLLVARALEPQRPQLPAGAARALDDLEGFLPMRNYTLLDTGVMRTAANGFRSLRSAAAQISLGGDKGYVAELRFRGDPRAAATSRSSSTCARST